MWVLPGAWLTIFLHLLIIDQNATLVDDTLVFRRNVSLLGYLVLELADGELEMGGVHGYKEAPRPGHTTSNITSLSMLNSWMRASKVFTLRFMSIFRPDCVANQLKISFFFRFSPCRAKKQSKRVRWWRGEGGESCRCRCHLLSRSHSLSLAFGFPGHVFALLN